MCFLQYVGRGYGSYLRGIIVDTEYKPLEDIKAQGERLYTYSGAKFKHNRADYCWEWPGGEKLFLRAAKTMGDAEKFLGHSYSYIGLNEITKWNTSEVHDRLLATIRAGELRAMGIKPLVFSTTNPYGSGAIWVKRRFINLPLPYGWLNEELVEVPVDLSGKYETIRRSKIAIPGSFRENPFYTLEDRANLLEACEGRPELYAAWVNGSWDAPYMDGALGAVWNSNVHVIDEFKIPSGWHLNRAFDWGYRSPFSVGWFAESNGEEFEHNGQRLCFPRGTVIQFAEWYGSNSIGKNRGIQLTARDIARGIKMREENFKANGLIQGDAKIYAGPADNQIAAATGVGKYSMDTIKSDMSAEYCNWLESDKSKGSRAIGLQAILTGLKNSLRKEGAGLYFMRRCKAAIEILPSLQAEFEDIAAGQEDHCYDMLRYRLVMKRRQGVSNVRVTF